jgi:hypothetical protein
MARPSKWTEQLQSEIVALVEAGDAPEVAAGVHGIGRSTHFEWMATNEGYRTAVARAKDVFESKSRAIVLDGDEKGNGFGPAKARLEVLGRRFPRRWSVQVKVEMADNLNRFIDAAQRICSPEDFCKLLEALAEEPSEGEAGGASG